MPTWFDGEESREASRKLRQRREGSRQKGGACGKGGAGGYRRCGVHTYGGSTAMDKEATLTGLLGDEQREEDRGGLIAVACCWLGLGRDG